MLRGLGRSPFAPRPPQALGPMPRWPNRRRLPIRRLIRRPGAGSRRRAAVLRSPLRRGETMPQGIDPAQAQYDSLKHHIHTRLVDRLDMNRIAEIDPKTLRNEIRGVVEQLCDTENPC